MRQLRILTPPATLTALLAGAFDFFFSDAAPLAAIALAAAPSRAARARMIANEWAPVKSHDTITMTTIAGSLGILAEPARWEAMAGRRHTTDP